MRRRRQRGPSAGEGQSLVIVLAVVVEEDDHPASDGDEPVETTVSTGLGPMSIDRVPVQVQGSITLRGGQPSCTRRCKGPTYVKEA
jgi:hypothetical protein